jgi:hypothetical protein
MQESYGWANPETRRKFNQAFFKHVIVTDKQITEAKLAEPFRSLLTVPTIPRWAQRDDVRTLTRRLSDLLALARAIREEVA